MQFGSRYIDLAQPRVMGVLNITPDSFSDGGQLLNDAGQVNLDAVLHRAEGMVADGADFLDVGGESTRPGAEAVPVEAELARVLPVVEALASRLPVAVSIDTSTPEVMREAAELGAGLINDVRALSRPGALAAAAATGLPVCLMHMQGEPATMQAEPCYHDVVSEVLQCLETRIAAAVGAGVRPDRLLVDPGIGFGKRDEHNWALLGRLSELSALAPVLLGVSRKSLFGRALGREVHERLPASLAAGLLAVDRGAVILRVHDVRATVDALRVRAYFQG